MLQGKTLIIVLVALIVGFGAGFVLRPVVAPSDERIAMAGPTIPAVSAEARGTPYFALHRDEARRVVAGCQDGSVRGGECANAEAAVVRAEAKERYKKFVGR